MCVYVGLLWTAVDLAQVAAKLGFEWNEVCWGKHVSLLQQVNGAQSLHLQLRNST